jgi:simple sugar transport system permease protein
VGGLIDPELAASVLRSLTPVLLAAFGGLLCAKVGVFNVALEGFMLTGSFAAVAGSWFTGNPWAGVVAGTLGGVLMAAILSYVSVVLGADAIIVGIALNLLAAGLTSFLVRTVLGAQGTFQNPKLVGLPVVLGQSPLTYFALVLVPVLAIFLRRTVWGFRLRGVGETPDAARSLGVDARRYQFVTVLVSGAFCGLAGAQLSLGNVVLFSENMTAGRGWVAVVVVMLGQAAPVGTLAAALLFAVAEALGFRLQGQGLPSQFTTAGPYLITLVALAIVSVRVRRLVARREEAGPRDLGTALRGGRVRRLASGPPRDGADRSTNSTQEDS